MKNSCKMHDSTLVRALLHVVRSLPVRFGFFNLRFVDLVRSMSFAKYIMLPVKANHYKI